MDDLKRISCLLLAALVGVAGVAGFVYLTWSEHRILEESLPKSEAEFYKQEYVIELCVIFFALIYHSGRVFALLFRAPALATEIQSRGNWHLTILASMLGLTILLRLWFTSKHGWHRFDNVFTILVLVALLALTIVFKLKIGLREK